MSLTDVWQKLFSNFQWQNKPSTATPLGKTNLQKLNDAIDGIDDRVLDLKGGVDDITTALDDKVDKVEGKGLSTNDYDNTAKGIVDGVTSALAGKVDKVEGKGLSENDFTDTLKDKLDGISEQANKVEITPVVTEGTTLATISIDGVDTAIKGSDIEVDDELKPDSTNPVQNKIIYETLQNILPEETAEGNPISITDASGLNAKSCEVTMNPIQDLHGQSAPYPAGGGKNLAKPYSYSAGITSYDGNGNVTISGTVQASSYVPSIATAITEGFFLTLPAGTYKPSTEKELPNGLQLNVMNKNNQPMSTGGSFTLTEETEVLVRIAILQGGTYNWTSGLMLEAGSQATDYAPYSNICPISGRTEVSVIRTGKNQLDLADISGTETNAYYHNISTDYKLKANVTYTLSFDVQTSVSPFNMSVGVGTESGSYSADVAVKNNNSNGRVFITFTPTQEQLSQYEYLKIRLPRYASQTTFTYSIKDIQLELGSTATTYEPYQGQTHTATFPDTVYGGTDEIVGGTGLSNMGMVDLGSLNWQMATHTTSGVVRFQANVSALKGSGDNQTPCNMLCSIYKNDSWSNVVGVVNDKSICGLGSLGGTIAVQDSNYETAEAFKTAMSGVQLCYELATPTPFSTTPTPIPLNKGNNVLFTDGDNITLKYSADIKEWVLAQLQS